MKHESFSIKKRFKSFAYAFNGLITLVREEHNARIHLGAAIIATAFGVILKISPREWIAVCFAIGFVFAMESINSSIEALADFVSKERHEEIKKIKDMSAAGVLVSAITALVIGMIVFLL